MKELKVFTNPMFGKVRTISKDGEPWFVSVDVCRALEIANSRDAVARLDEDEKLTVALTDSHSGRGGARSITIVSEAGLYALVLSSRKPEARAFKRWITHEVIPDIRKHGMYMTPDVVEGFLANPDAMIQALTAYRDEKARRIAAESEKAALAVKLEEAAPKIAFADGIAASPDCVKIEEFARTLANAGIRMGEKRFRDWLRARGYIQKDGKEPYQPHIDSGLFVVDQYIYRDCYGRMRLGRVTKITGLGQQKLLEALRRDFLAA